VLADRELCVSAGQCQAEAGAVFDQDPEDGTVVVISEYPEIAQAESVMRAVEACPSGALQVESE
jgi:ferredoxin